MIRKSRQKLGRRWEVVGLKAFLRRLSVPLVLAERIGANGRIRDQNERPSECGWGVAVKECIVKARVFNTPLCRVEWFEMRVEDSSQRCLAPCPVPYGRQAGRAISGGRSTW